jgi:lipid II:glycine glycyltransferase (peptidoglycan interpeptide bridge formation enzyme)
MGLLTVSDGEKRVARLSREKKIAALVAEYIKKEFRTIYVRFSPEVTDMQPFIWAGYSVGVRYTYIVDISDLDKTWIELEATRRTNIRKAERAGLRVRQDLELNELLDVIGATLQRQDTSDYPSMIRRYDDYLGRFGKRKIFGICNTEGELVAGIYVAWDNKRSYYLSGGYRDGSYRGAPAMALWEAMKFTRNELGLQQFDLAGSMVPGIEKFFRFFGGELVPTYTASWIHPRWYPYVTIRSGLSYLKAIFRNEGWGR